MNIEKYKNDGWGLSKLVFSKIEEIITNTEKKEFNILEFGSGTSTKFLSDLSLELKDKKIKITSFDNDERFMYKSKPDDNIDLKVRELIECDDEHYEKMFTEKKYLKYGMHVKRSALSTRQKNNFYDLQKNDLNNFYDLIILDGPNGNGRSISFLHLISHVKSGTLIIVDDCTHHDFIEKIGSTLNVEEIFKNNTGINSQWENGGDFIIYEVK